MPIAQLYSFMSTGESRNVIAPAQFVVNEPGDEIVGFIVSVIPHEERPTEEAEAVACLFKPRDIPSDLGLKVILTEMPDETVRGMLAFALINNPSMKPEWEKRLNPPQEDK
jgi:hypothetical protein